MDDFWKKKKRILGFLCGCCSIYSMLPEMLRIAIHISSLSFFSFFLSPQPQEHIFLVSELLKENLYEYGKRLRHSAEPNYFTIPRLQKIAKQVLV
jgi:hypothetical protein